MRLLLATLAAAVLAAAPAPAADDPGAAAFAEKVTVEIKDQPLRSALDEFFAGSGLSYTLAPEVPNVSIRLSLRDLRRETALALIVRIARAAFPGLYYTREGANVVIWVDPNRPEAPVAEVTVTPDAALANSRLSSSSA